MSPDEPQPPLVLWFNPACSKCRRALELLEQRGVAPTLRRYLEQPPTIAELASLVDRLGRPPLALVRTNEADAQRLGLGEDTSREAVLAALAQHPGLLERPIAVRGERAVVARPPERVLELLA
jgi:arsenate reductase